MYDPMAKDMISEAIKEYFEHHTQSSKPRFHTSSVLRLSSSTVTNEMNKKSRIEFVRAEARAEL